MKFDELYPEDTLFKEVSVFVLTTTTTPEWLGHKERDELLDKAATLNDTWVFATREAAEVAAIKNALDWCTALVRKPPVWELQDYKKYRRGGALSVHNWVWEEGATVYHILEVPILVGKPPI